MADFIDFPIFTGVSGDLKHWILWLEEFFVRERFTAMEKMNLAQSLLAGEAESWFYSLKRSIFRSWEHLMDLLIWWFGDVNEFGDFIDPELFRLWDKNARILQARRVEKRRKRMKTTAITPQESISSPATIHETVPIDNFSNQQVDEISGEKKDESHEATLVKVLDNLEEASVTQHQMKATSIPEKVTIWDTETEALIPTDTIPVTNLTESRDSISATKLIQESNSTPVMDGGVSFEKEISCQAVEYIHTLELFPAKESMENAESSSAKDASISQTQVPVSSLEPGLSFSSEIIDVSVAWPFEMVSHNRVHSQAAFECVKNKNNAHHVLDELSLRRHKLQQRKKLSLSPKSRMFKFKNRTLLSNWSQMDLHQAIDINKVNNLSPCFIVNFGLVRKKRTFQCRRLKKQAHKSRILCQLRMLHDPGGKKDEHSDEIFDNEVDIDKVQRTQMDTVSESHSDVASSTDVITKGQTPACAVVKYAETATSAHVMQTADWDEACGAEIDALEGTGTCIVTSLPARCGWLVFDRGKTNIISGNVIILERDGQTMLLVKAKDTHVDSLTGRIKIILSCGVIALRKQIQWAEIQKLSLYKELWIEIMDGDITKLLNSTGGKHTISALELYLSSVFSTVTSANSGWLQTLLEQVLQGGDEALFEQVLQGDDEAYTKIFDKLQLHLNQGMDLHGASGHRLFPRQQSSSSIWHRWRRKGALQEEKPRVKQRTDTHEYMSIHGSTTTQVPVFAFSHLSARALQRVQSSEPPELLEEVLWIHEAVLDVGYADMGRWELLVQWQNLDSFATSGILSKGLVCFYLAFKLEDKLVLQGESIDTIQGLSVGGKTPIEAEALLLSLRGSINRETELILEVYANCCEESGLAMLLGRSMLISRDLCMIYAMDVNEGRLRILGETAKSHQVDGLITTIHSDLRAFAETSEVQYDKVLLDAPCSGLGVLSKRADLRWNRKLEDMVELTKLQDELLDSASKLVKHGGVLIYSTCSIDPEENEGRVEAFLLRHPEFSIDPVTSFVPSSFVTSQGFFLSNPVKHSLDGAFAARLVRAL